MTVITVVDAQRARMERNLVCMLNQTALASIEILVMDLRHGQGPLRGAEHPAVRQIPLEEGITLREALATGVRKARGEIVAIIEDHCFPDPGWASAVVEAFHRPVAMVNYAFQHFEPQSYLSRAFLMAEYGRWMAPATEGPVSIPACNNIAYRREVLMRFDERLEERLKVEYLLHREIQAAGGTVWLASRALVAHEGWSRLADGLRANACMKRCNAAGAAFGPRRWSWPRRLFYAAAMVATPGLHLWRLVWSLRNRPALWGQFVAALPVSLTVYCYVAWFEALGYVFGAGTSEADFRDIELAASRQSS